MRISLVIFTLACLLSSAHVLAIELQEPVTETIVVNPVSYSNAKFAASGSAMKQVQLMSFKLTHQEADTLFNYTPSPVTPSAGMPSRINLGMNNVPVLDQGMHGTCVTFATIAAIDAILGKGDYVSALCGLELGTTLSKTGYFASGWHGTFGPAILEQYLRFGVVPKEYEQTKSCAGVRAYPLLIESNEGMPMSLDEYKSMSQDTSRLWYPVFLMSWAQRLDPAFANDIVTDQALLEVKKSLNKGNRVTVGVFMVPDSNCYASACGRYHVANDTWALTSETTHYESDKTEMSGHEMVIIGYDDEAVAVDQEGKSHQGLLILRNSWGSGAGDHGDYYMTYDYFKKFVGELQAIVQVKN